MKFTPEPYPFPYWLGPYSPARGTSTGFRINNGQLGAWVSSGEDQTFWSVQDTDGTQQLTSLVKKHWQGGRVMFLPGGFVVKPLQNEDDRGLRIVVGRYEGGLTLSGFGTGIDLSQTTEFLPGSEWSGPGSIGLECTIQTDGSLITRWYQPSDFGHDEYREPISAANRYLISGFRRARPGDSAGRVRVTVGGHIITNKQAGDGWKPYYVGRVDAFQFSNWERWVKRR